MSNNCLYYDFRDGKPVCGKGICLTRLGEPTLEEVKKEWEALGYEWRTPIDYPHMIYLVDDDDEPKWLLTIKINTQSKRYWKIWDDGNFESFTFEEHNLLTKTFRALGWDDAN